MKTLLLFVAMLSPLCVAQDCPVAFKQIDPRFKGREILVNYTNVSGKKMEAVKFGVELVDPMGDVEEKYDDLIDPKPPKPGKSSRKSWSNILQRGYPKANVFVIRVKYEDGTEWKDTGAHSCNSGAMGMKH